MISLSLSNGILTESRDVKERESREPRLVIKLEQFTFLITLRG